MSRKPARLRPRGGRSQNGLHLTRRTPWPSASLRPRAGLAALAALDPALPRYTAVAAYPHERDGDLTAAARLYVDAAREAADLAERDHLTRQAARLHALLRGVMPGRRDGGRLPAR
jgi:hypothetical protein